MSNYKKNHAMRSFKTFRAKIVQISVWLFKNFSFPYPILINLRILFNFTIIWHKGNFIGKIRNDKTRVSFNIFRSSYVTFAILSNISIRTRFWEVHNWIKCVTTLNKMKRNIISPVDRKTMKTKTSTLCK